MKNETPVIYSNSLNEISFRGLRPVDMDLFWAIASKIRDEGTRELYFTRSEIQALANYTGTKNRTVKDFIKDMETMSRKLSGLYTTLRKECGGFTLFVLFPEFDVTAEGVRLEVSKRFAPWFNEITGGFTRFELEAIISLKSGYSKELFRHLMQFKSTGFMRWSPEQLRERLAIPKSYKSEDINKRVLNPALKELTAKDELGNKLFKTLNLKKVKGGYRNLQIVAYEFHFTPQTDKLLPKEEAGQTFEEKAAIKNHFGNENASEAHKNLKKRLKLAKNKGNLPKQKEAPAVVEAPEPQELSPEDQAKIEEMKTLQQKILSGDGRNAKATAFEVQKHENGGMTFTKKPAPELVEVPEEDFEDYSQYDEGRLNPYLQDVTTKEAIAKEFDEGGKRK